MQLLRSNDTHSNHVTLVLFWLITSRHYGWIFWCLIIKKNFLECKVELDNCTTIKRKIVPKEDKDKKFKFMIYIFFYCLCYYLLWINISLKCGSESQTIRISIEYGQVLLFQLTVTFLSNNMVFQF